MDPNQASNLYIYLGMDSIFRVKLNLRDFNQTTVEEVLISPTDGTGSKYAPFKGLFVMDSKLHCIGNVVGNSEEKVLSFNLPSFTPDQSTHFPCYHSFKSRPTVFTTISSNKVVYALDTTPTLDGPNSFEVFEPEIGDWKSLHEPPPIPLDTLTRLNSSHEVYEFETREWKSLPPPIPLHKLIVFQNNILLQTFYGDFIFDAKADHPNWKDSDKFFPRCFAALEYQEYMFVLSNKPYKLLIYELASFGEKDPVFRVIDLWNGFHLGSDADGHSVQWASLNLVGNNLICAVFIFKNKIHVSLIRFMKTFVYAVLDGFYVFHIPELKTSYDPSLYSTFYWGTDISCHETVENLIISSEHLTKADQIEDYSMGHKQVRYLYIYLGFGAFLSLKFNEPCNKDNSFLDSKSDLRLLFSHHDRGAEYPVGMGLFAWGSKVHFFGGENLEVSDSEMSCEDLLFLDFSDFVGLKSGVRPKYFKSTYVFEKDSEDGDGSSLEASDSTDETDSTDEADDWFNQKKVYSYDLPYFTRCNTAQPPGPSGWKLQPLVFTISNKIYALSTRTVSAISLSRFEDDEGELKLFEVFEPEKNEWHHIDELPPRLFEKIVSNTLEIESHCVFRDQMLLQTSFGEFVFDSVSEVWDNDTEMRYPKIYSALEYNKVLLVISRKPVQFLVYELASFGKEDCSYGKLDILDIEKKMTDFFPKHDVYGASLNLIDHKHINLVLFTAEDITVSVLKVEAPFRYAKVEAQKVFDVPKNCLRKIQPYSTFFFLHEDTKAAGGGPREENSTVGEPEDNLWQLFKNHLNKLYSKELYNPTWSEEE